MMTRHVITGRQTDGIYFRKINDGNAIVNLGRLLSVLSLLSVFCLFLHLFLLLMYLHPSTTCNSYISSLRVPLASTLCPGQGRLYIDSINCLATSRQACKQANKQKPDPARTTSRPFASAIFFTFCLRLTRSSSSAGPSSPGSSSIWVSSCRIAAPSAACVWLRFLRLYFFPSLGTRTPPFSGDVRQPRVCPATQNTLFGVDCGLVLVVCCFSSH